MHMYVCMYIDESIPKKHMNHKKSSNIYLVQDEIKVAQAHLRVSHVVPVSPVGHVHFSCSLVITHVPPFLHGLFLHGPK